MHGIFDGKLVQSELGRYGSELLLGRTIEPELGQAAAGPKRVIHAPQLERFGRARPSRYIADRRSSFGRSLR